jgi:hypothetical protein
MWVAFLVLELCSAASAQVPVHQEPLHRVVFENASLRVLDVTYQGAEMSLDHIHSNDIAIVCISGCQLRTRPLGGPWGEAATRRPGETTATAYAGQPTTHRHQNVGESLYRAISVENLRQTGWLEGTLATGGTLRLVNQTRAFRIYDVKLMAGTDETTHVHVFPTIAVLINGEATVRDNTRIPRVLDHPGGWVILPASEPHTLTTGGRGEAYVVEIEVR